jgi:hypothetical protein
VELLANTAGNRYDSPARFSIANLLITATKRILPKNCNRGFSPPGAGIVTKTPFTL